MAQLSRWTAVIAQSEEVGITHGRRVRQAGIMKLQFNPDAVITWHEIGDFGTWVMVVDDFLRNAEEVRAYALSLAYSVPIRGDYYPGTRAFVSAHGASEIVQWI